VLALLCEAAFEVLMEVNHPEGNCAFCLAPTAPNAESGGSGGSGGGGDGEGGKPFMKLMSCYHCFHTACFGDWWRWKLARAEEDEASGQARQILPATSQSQGGA
jgi:E3 ubiquitin-protein ligase RNF25